jgi:hypothetical protein
VPAQHRDDALRRPGQPTHGFGRLQLKAYAKGEHVLRFEATVHNAKELRSRRSLKYFDQIMTGWPE